MRKEKNIVIDDRGKSLTFKIREMSALQMEGWIARAGILLAGTGILDETRVDVRNAGEIAAGVARAVGESGISALGRLDYDKARPLLDELLSCCSRVDAGVEQPLTPDVLEGFIEDVRTLFTLRKEALALNFGFFAQGGPSASVKDGPAPQPDTLKPRISVRSRR
jgi:hypothetical protein